MRFFLDCVPSRTTHHAKRIVRIGKFSRLADKPELVSAKAMLDALLLPHQPGGAMQGALVLRLVFIWPWLKSDTKAMRARGWVPHTKRPDADNVAKSVADRLMALRFIEDDAAIVDLHITKWRGDRPGIDVEITPWA